MSLLNDALVDLQLHNAAKKDLGKSAAVDSKSFEPSLSDGELEALRIKRRTQRKYHLLCSGLFLLALTVIALPFVKNILKTEHQENFSTMDSVQAESLPASLGLKQVELDHQKSQQSSEYSGSHNTEAANKTLHGSDSSTKNLLLTKNLNIEAGDTSNQNSRQSQKQKNEQAMGVPNPGMHSIKIDKISATLALAQLALDEDRLTKPRENNALSLYKNVLRIDSKNSKALEGLEQIKRRYLQLIKNAYVRKDKKLAEGFSESLKSVLKEFAINESEIDEYQQIIASYSFENLAAPKSEAGLDKPTLVAKASKQEQPLSIKPSFEQSQSDLIAAYEAAIARGEEAAATELLEVHLSRLNRSAESDALIVETLLDHYLRYQQFNDLERVLSQRQRLGESWHFFKAALLNEYSNRKTVLAYLAEQYSNNQLKAERALSLFAGLLNESKDYSKAVSVYQRLISSQPQNAVYYLGLAIAEESRGNKKVAIKAYQRSLLIGEHEPKVALFIYQRLQHLDAVSASRLELSQW